MAKKKTIDIKTVTADVPSGDVNISYKNTRIAGLSESVTAVLETKDTICEDDIEVEYTKSGGTTPTNISVAFTLTNGASIGGAVIFYNSYDSTANAIVTNSVTIIDTYTLSLATTTGGSGIKIEPSGMFDSITVNCDGQNIPSIDSGLSKTRFVIPATAQAVTITIA